MTGGGKGGEGRGQRGTTDTRGRDENNKGHTRPESAGHLLLPFSPKGLIQSSGVDGFCTHRGYIKKTIEKVRRIKLSEKELTLDGDGN